MTARGAPRPKPNCKPRPKKPIMEIPILIDHDRGKIVGKVYIDNNQLKVHIFYGGVLREDLFEIFGNVGASLTDIELVDGSVFIKSCTIHQFSFQGGVIRRGRLKKKEIPAVPKELGPIENKNVDI